MISKEKAIIIDIIKSNIEESDYSKKEVSILSGISEVSLSNLLSGRESITLEKSQKLSKVFDNLKGDGLFLINTYRKLIQLNETNEEELEIAKSVEALNLYDKYTQIEIIRKNINGSSFNNFQEFVLNSSTSFSKYLDKSKPLAKLWLILMYKKYKNINNPNEFKKSTKETIYKKVLEIFFKNEKFPKREKEIENFLFQRGVVLKSGPFIANSSIKGVSLKKKTTRFIFLSDMFKREYRWIISLVHELAHFYENITNEIKIESFAVNKIKDFIMKNNIANKDFDVFFSLYKDNDFLTDNKEEYFSELREKTSNRINFGDPNKLINTLFE